MCRQGPAHQGMKSRRCGLIHRIGAADSATPRARPERGTSPSPRVVFDRATFPFPAPLDSGFRRNDEWSGRIYECGSVGMGALTKPRKVIFVPIAHPGLRRHTKV